MKSIRRESICSKCEGAGKVLAEGEMRRRTIFVNCTKCGGEGFIGDRWELEEDIEDEDDIDPIIHKRGRRKIRVEDNDGTYSSG